MKKLFAAVLAATAVWAVATSALATEQRRVALVVGNQAYQYAGELTMTRADASDFGGALQQLGFEVTVVHDSDRRELDAALQSFRRDIRDADVALFYYSGHGLEVDGENYLAPVGARLDGRQSLRREMMALNDVLETVESGGAQFNLVVLDACRNNPFVEQMGSGMRSVSSSGAGLAAVAAPAGTVIAFATAPGTYAWEGGEEFDNSIFTEALLEWIDEPEMELAQMLRMTRQTVIDWTDGEQVPWENSAMTGSFYFNPEGVEVLDQPAIASTDGASGTEQTRPEIAGAEGVLRPESSTEPGQPQDDAQLQPAEPGLAAPTQTAMLTMEPSMVAGILDDMLLPYAMQRDSYGDPYIDVDVGSGLPSAEFGIWFFDCDGNDHCGSIQLWSWFDPRGRVDLRQINQWNASQRWAIASLQEGRYPVLVLDLNAVGGVGREQVADLMYTYIDQMHEFTQYIPY